jgi:hypothetical protein
MSLTRAPEHALLPILDPWEAEFARETPDRTCWILVAVALGLLAMATTARGFREQASWAPFVYWGTLLVLFVLVTVRVLLPSTLRRERIVASVAFALAAFAARPLLYPLRFQEHDELLHLTTLRGIIQTHHLFGANNGIPVSPFYPGLELATDGLRSITGLSSHTSGLIILAIAKVVMTLAIILIIERLTGSSRAACLGTLVYAANPQFFIFNSQFSYQSLALPMALLVLALLATVDPHDERRTMIAVCAAILVVTFSHHLTSMALGAALVGWWLLELPRGARRLRRRVGLAALVSVGSVLAWLPVPGRMLTSYLGQVLVSSFTALVAQVEGKQHHQLFRDYAGSAPPEWQRLLIVVSTALICVCLLPAAWRCRRFLNRGSALGGILLLGALAYPLVPAGHLTTASAEVADRSAGFVFIGLALVFGYSASGWLQRQAGIARDSHRERRSEQRMRFVVLAVVVVAVVGGTIAGVNPGWNAVPGKFLVSADNRTVDSVNLSAADWARSHLPKSSLVFSDRINRLLISSIGGQQIITHVAGAIDLSPAMFDPVLTGSDLRDMRADHVDYFLIDRRQARQLPRVGVYFEQGEPGQFAHKRPIPMGALQKFDSVPGVSRIYDNGADSFYDVRRASARP